MDHYSIENVGPGTWVPGQTFFRHPITENGQYVGSVHANLNQECPEDDDRRAWIVAYLKRQVEAYGVEQVREAIARDLVVP